MTIFLVWRYVAGQGQVVSVWSTEDLALAEVERIQDIPGSEPLALCYGETVHSEPWLVDGRHWKTR